MGLSGCGKTSLARALAASLGIDAYDSDKLVEEKEGLTITEIFQKKGEAYFRTAERNIIQSLANDWRGGQIKPFVLASGGGAMAHLATRKILQTFFTTVWLDCSPSLLAHRLGATQDRPLLTNTNKEKDKDKNKAQLVARLEEMHKKRKKFYAKAHARLVVAEREAIEDLLARFDDKTLDDSPSSELEAERDLSSESIRLNLSSESYEVFVGARLFEQPPSPLLRAEKGRTILVTERKLVHYAELLRQSLQNQGYIVAMLAISLSEGQKRLHNVEKLCQRFSEIGADRQSFVIVLGGGVLCDLAAFAASIFMRGLSFALFPTTLLAQVDAAIGGKNGVNSVAGKNMLGVFRQPAAVVCDTDSLRSLSEREMRCGYAEILKYAMIADEKFFVWLEVHGERLLAGEARVLTQAVVHSVRIKASIVERDEQERFGERALLNFGHTFGHALERLSLYRVAHGEAVALGCVLATRLSVALGRCAPSVSERLEAHARLCGLPVRLSDLKLGDFRMKQLSCVDRWLEAMSQDKKRHAGALRLVLPHKIGSCVLQAPMELKSLRVSLVPLLRDLAKGSG